MRRCFTTLPKEAPMRWHPGCGRRGFLRLVAMSLVTAAMALGLYACKNATDEKGVVGISLTDEAGDFLSYTVDVPPPTRTKADGPVVQALPLRARVDFARLVDLTEFV